MSHLPLGLRQVLESGDCVLFIGAGVGGHLRRPDGTTAPDGPQLAKDLSANFGIVTSSTDLAKVAELVEIRKERAALEAFVKRSPSESRTRSGVSVADDVSLEGDFYDKL